MTPAHHNDRGGSDDHRRRDAEADIDVDTGLNGLRLHEQCESQEGDHTTYAYDMFETFHMYILIVQQRLRSHICRVIHSMLLHVCCLVVYAPMTHT